MNRSTNIVKRKVGRPVEIGAEASIGIRMPKTLLIEIDGWAERKGIRQRSAAIRKLVETALAMDPAPSKRAKKR